MPGVADRPGPLPESPLIGEAKDLAPVPDGFVRNGDAPVRKEVFDVAEAQGEAVVKPDGVADGGGREPVAWVGAPSSASSYCARGPLKLTMPLRLRGSCGLQIGCRCRVAPLAVSFRF
jgi:hypothetical protein